MDLLKSTSILLKLLPLIEASCVFKTERFKFIVFAAGEFALEIDVKVPSLWSKTSEASSNIVWGSTALPVYEYIVCPFGPWLVIKLPSLSTSNIEFPLESTISLSVTSYVPSVFVFLIPNFAV